MRGEGVVRGVLVGVVRGLPHIDVFPRSHVFAVRVSRTVPRVGVAGILAANQIDLVLRTRLVGHVVVVMLLVIVGHGDHNLLKSLNVMNVYDSTHRSACAPAENRDIPPVPRLFYGFLRTITVPG
ncbi:hypothetical protein EJO69_01210 [Flaviflexus salsibiostraticola]|uniref:Uncharacterized protein n=1 Tax=Flaviflexus salsibiostraticola TaxID=1282737 RepID=A0A3Q8WS81_9ACTO|nr:hypothetical protein [Flaviflexus salsibiostraticola]AZN29069.1 hypothetical protein EJO69_01210 [Flaviflexus salsibiostraticola]